MGPGGTPLFSSLPLQPYDRLYLHVDNRTGTC